MVDEETLNGCRPDPEDLYEYYLEVAAPASAETGEVLLCFSLVFPFVSVMLFLSFVFFSHLNGGV